MTVLSHLHPSFNSVFSIEAANEVTMDSSKTPGYGDCTYFSTFLSVSEFRSLISWTVQKNFVAVVRATELLLGVVVPGIPAIQFHNALDIADLSGLLATASIDGSSGLFVNGSAVVKALTKAIPMLIDIERELTTLSLNASRGKTPLTTRLVFPHFVL